MARSVKQTRFLIPPSAPCPAVCHHPVRGGHGAGFDRLGARSDPQQPSLLPIPYKATMQPAAATRAASPTCCSKGGPRRRVLLRQRERHADEMLYVAPSSLVRRRDRDRRGVAARAGGGHQPQIKVSIEPYVTCRSAS
jgi:hypothetical protein